jgi:hypothetical protein
MERWLVQSTHQRGKCLESTGRDGDEQDQSRGVLIFKVMHADLTLTTPPAMVNVLMRWEHLERLSRLGTVP